MKNLEFTQDSGYHEPFLLSRKEFKKIINNFDFEKFKSNFDEVFFNEDKLSLFLKNENRLICGALGYIYEKRVFMDIFFWNHDLGGYNMHTVRVFFENFFLKSQEMGATEAILPLDEDRKKFLSFKKHNQIFFRSTEEFKTNDSYITDHYKRQYLLKVNYEHYFNESK